MTGSPLRLASAILALVSLGLLLSLLPRTSFVSVRAGDIVDVVGPVWPEQSVEQVMDDGLGSVAEIRIWGAAGVGRGEAPVVAGLLRGPDRELVRQVRVGIKDSHLPQPYVLEFAPYDPVPGEALVLQLWVTDERQNHAIFATTKAGDDGGGPSLNLNPTGKGPLAYEVIWRGDGWRAALAGSRLDLARLAGGVAAAVAAVLLSPPVARRIRRALGRIHAAVLVVGRLVDGKLRLTGAWSAPQVSPGAPASIRRAIYLFPWLIPAFAILHFLANNLLVVRAYEAIAISLVIMAGVTITFVGLRIILRSAAAAAVFTSLAGIAFFSYGHIYAEGDPPDDRYFFGVGVPVVLGIALLLRHRSIFPPAIFRFLNLASLVLLALPIAQILVLVSAATFLPERNDSAISDFPALNDRIMEAKASIPPSDIPDIYYIILDEYPRSGTPESFDNSVFIQHLESRGFYVDPHARSNYPTSVYSISTSLNMTYPESYREDQFESYRLFQRGHDHALGRIAQALGYKYIHVSSGWYFTNSSPIADQVVTFDQSGHSAPESTVRDSCVAEKLLSLSNEFTIELLQTTMADRFLHFDVGWDIGVCADHWKHPALALGWIEFMKSAATIDGPKFVFAHLVKPHDPYSFDRYGNISPHREGWDDDHDPTVASAFYGQLLWLNGQILDVIDGILAESREPPIIVIAGDHGVRKPWWTPEAIEILAAYLLPDGEKLRYTRI